MQIPLPFFCKCFAADHPPLQHVYSHCTPFPRPPSAANSAPSPLNFIPLETFARGPLRVPPGANFLPLLAFRLAACPWHRPSHSHFHPFAHPTLLHKSPLQSPSSHSKPFNWQRVHHTAPHTHTHSPMCTCACTHTGTATCREPYSPSPQSHLPMCTCACTHIQARPCVGSLTLLALQIHTYTVHTCRHTRYTKRTPYIHRTHHTKRTPYTHADIRAIPCTCRHTRYTLYMYVHRTHMQAYGLYQKHSSAHERFTPSLRHHTGTFTGTAVSLGA